TTRRPRRSSSVSRPRPHRCPSRRSGCWAERWLECPTTPRRSHTATGGSMMNAVALYGDPAERATHEAWVDAFAQAVQRGPVGAYVNFLGDEGEARVRPAYPGR